jgi:dihydroorotate dehydrogenase (NAD+) catalytic subunit
VHQVYQVCKAHNIPIIGQGGITTTNDALEFLIAGASAIGLGTGLFYDPFLSQKINLGIADYLAANDLDHLSELIGSLDC